MALYCRVCGFENLRTSRFRFRMRDLARLLSLRLPVRCMNCDERFFVSVPHFFVVRHARKALHREHTGAK